MAFTFDISHIFIIDAKLLNPQLITHIAYW